MNERLFRQIEFIKEIDKIKKIIRKSQHFSDEQYENDAEHSWHIAMMAVTFYEYAEGQPDLLKVVKMLLIHDIVEIDAGDVYVYAKTDQDRVNELNAAKRIFGMLPEDTARELYELWLEFEERKTAEAKYANAVDRLQPVMQNIHNGMKTWREGLTTHEKVLAMNSKIGDGAPLLWDYIREEINTAFQTIAE